jgi:hypothetical protein
MKEDGRSGGSHPPAFKLDALAAGDVDPAAQAHVTGCEACAAYVKTLRGEAAAFRATSDAAAFANAVVARAKKPAGSARVLRLAWVAAPALAAAAVIALGVRGGEPPASRGRAGAESTVAGTHFKGGISVVAIRERGGVQQRLSGPFEVMADDRVRVEVALDRDLPIAAGLLSDDGTWTPLLAPAALSAGTHFSELAARFDGAPTDALLLVGSPDDVARARATRSFEGVVAWRVRSEPPK